MSQSTILAAGTTAASSTDIVVTTTPVSVSVFSAAGGRIGASDDPGTVIDNVSLIA